MTPRLTLSAPWPGFYKALAEREKPVVRARHRGSPRNRRACQGGRPRWRRRGRLRPQMAERAALEVYPPGRDSPPMDLESYFGAPHIFDQPKM